MAQIFVSHSKRDQDLVGFFSSAFAGTKVKAVFEEFEKILTGEITSPKVMQDIENSNAVFVILSQNVQKIPHTRDWVVWETGIAKNKDIWVFEPYSQLDSISVVTPYLRHYVIFSMTEDWFGYIRNIIESYDDSHILPTVLTGAGIGAALAEEDKVGGAFLGGIGGAIAGHVLFGKSIERPRGWDIVCSNCRSSYNAHIPQEMVFRCPVCNTHLILKE